MRLERIESYILNYLISKWGGVYGCEIRIK